jgi:hypothetical protein
MALGTLGLDDDDDESDLMESDSDGGSHSSGGVNTVPYEDFDGGDSMDMFEENSIFDEGGFDFGDDYGDSGSGGGDDDMC